MHVGMLYIRSTQFNLVQLHSRMLLIRGTFAAIALQGLLLQFARALLDDNPDIELKTPALAKKYGYPVEIHSIVTEDGYILEIHRIPRGRRKYSARGIERRIPILLQHGLAGSSADWIIRGPEISLAYRLADMGYDVWLGNNRGNVYSREHATISPDDLAFWNFSFHELGIYDLPATIDYIIWRTGMDRIFYIGHSQGTTQFWILASEKPQYNSKIILMAGLAPVAYTGNIRGPIMKLAKMTYFGMWVGETFGYPEFGPRSSWGKFVSNLFCQDAAPTQFLCSRALFPVAGFSREELDYANLTVIIGHVPAGASWKQFVHFGQGYVHPGHFRHFDYANSKKNLELYNSTVPPEYNLGKITTPIALFSSNSDKLAAPKDVKILRSKLRNVVFDYKISVDEKFNHYDFIWGIKAPRIIFDPLFRLLEQYRIYSS